MQLNLLKSSAQTKKLILWIAPPVVFVILISLLMIKLTVHDDNFAESPIIKPKSEAVQLDTTTDTSSDALSDQSTEESNENQLIRSDDPILELGILIEDKDRNWKLLSITALSPF